jgi:hypothetical protein
VQAGAARFAVTKARPHSPGWVHATRPARTSGVKVAVAKCGELSAELEAKIRALSDPTLIETLLVELGQAQDDAACVRALRRRLP